MKNTECHTYVSFGEIARTRLGKQFQYASRYFCRLWKKKYRFLGEGLRIKGNSANYHTMLIHKDDVEEAVKRYLEFAQVKIDQNNDSIVNTYGLPPNW